MAKEQETMEYNCTRITPNMVVTGDIESSDNILIEGQVFGNVTTSADITASNLVVGNVKGGSIALSTARVKGSLTMQGTVAIGDGTIVVGDIKAEALKVVGKVKGNIHVTESALLAESALIVGDITAGYVTTQAGARINGTITTTYEQSTIDVDTEFDLGNLDSPEKGGTE